jgi:hypothetical protein
MSIIIIGIEYKSIINKTVNPANLSSDKIKTL